MDYFSTRFNWGPDEPDDIFLDEETMDNSVIERILRNKFRDPMCSSESEDEERTKIDWEKIFKRENNERQNRIFVPGLKKVPPYPKLSVLTSQQHYQLLKVLCKQYPTVLPDEFIPRPTKSDLKAFDILKEVYLKEQKEYLSWAKTMWTTIHCVNVLRPKPGIELVYEAEFKLKEKELSSFPKQYAMAAQIPLASKSGDFEFLYKKDVLNAKLNDLPHVIFPDLTKRCSILRPCSVPEPCHKHPCRFILPKENSVSILPTTEVYRELAQFALDKGSQLLLSEKALKCLVETDRDWILPVSVFEIIGAGGDKNNVLVIGSDFTNHMEGSQMRTYKAFRHLLEYSLIPAAEKLRELDTKVADSSEDVRRSADLFKSFFSDLNVDSDDEDHLFIDTGDADDTEAPNSSIEQTNSKPDDSDNEMQIDASDGTEHTNKTTENDKTDSRKSDKDRSNEGKTDEKGLENEEEKNKPLKEKDSNKATKDKKDDFYVCTCEESFYVPPRRSYKKWEVKNKSTGDKYDFIVHCSHKIRHPLHGVRDIVYRALVANHHAAFVARDVNVDKSGVMIGYKSAINYIADAMQQGRSGEMILEPIPEYQIGLGASELSEHKIKSLLVSLLLRRNASLMTVRIDGSNGDIVTYDNISADDYIKDHEGLIPCVSNTIFNAIDQLQGLLPGHYLLQHEPSHGENAMLYATRILGNAQTLTLDFNMLVDTDEAKSVKTPPTLGPTLLPYHKFRKILPCAFTPFDCFVAKETKKPPARQKTPPQAIKWPKRKPKKRGKKKH